MADEPKVRGASRPRAQDSLSSQTDVPVEMPRHRDVMPIDHGKLIAVAKRLARVVGALYLLIVVLGGVAHLGVRAGIRVSGDAAAAAQNIGANPTLFRVSLVADIAMATIFVFVGITLYLLFRHIDRHAPGALVVFVAVGAGMILVNLLFHHTALLVATDPSHHALDAQNSDGLVSLLRDMHDHGYKIAGVFLGLCLLPLGHLAYQSSRFPRVLGILLVASWVVSTLVGFGRPDLPAVIHKIIAPPPVADFWMVLYLVTKGVRVPRPHQLAPAAV